MSWTEIMIAIKKSIVASGESVANIISGSTKVGNADKLDGKDSNYFATAASVTNITNGTTTVPKADTLDGYHASSFSLASSSRIKLFSDITDIGLTSAATLSATWIALPINSMIIMDASSLTDSSWNFPDKYSLVVMYKGPYASRGYIELKPKEHLTNTCFMVFTATSGPAGQWHTWLNTGNSAPVIVSTTEPSDKTAVWIVPN